MRERVRVCLSMTTRSADTSANNHCGVQCSPVASDLDPSWCNRLLINAFNLYRPSKNKSMNVLHHLLCSIMYVVRSLGVPIVVAMYNCCIRCPECACDTHTSIHNLLGIDPLPESIWLQRQNLHRASLLGRSW